MHKASNFVHTRRSDEEFRVTVKDEPDSPISDEDDGEPTTTLLRSAADTRCRSPRNERSGHLTHRSPLGKQVVLRSVVCMCRVSWHGDR